mmetsp:Transcript_94888/g.268631  ORF Transcript_94888/g.268631 Transcript_94888/m.268631 type:complete len:283 (-) Transcript_94888:78-926(-)
MDMRRHVPLVSLTLVAGALGIVNHPHPDHRDPCICRTWSQRYKYETITCGQGPEFYHGSPAAPEIYKDTTPEQQNSTCENFFTKIDTGICVNYNLGRDQGTWCYVSPTCSKLNGGGAFPGQLNWKKCQKGRSPDPMFRDYMPEMLRDFARQRNIWLPTLVRYAYPGQRADYGVLARRDDLKDGVPDTVRAALAQVGDPTAPMWLDTEASGDLPLMIVFGNTVWEVYRQETKYQHVDRPGTWAALRCFSGCDAIQGHFNSSTDIHEAMPMPSLKDMMKKMKRR